MEEDLEIRPAKVESPAMSAVEAIVTEEEAWIGPAICNDPATVDEAEEIKPFKRDKVPLALNLEISANKPFCKIEKVKAP